jgi:diguanylate cyclase (GGDEF)-like protein
MEYTLNKLKGLTMHTNVLHSVTSLDKTILFEYAIDDDHLFVYLCNEGSIFELFDGSTDKLKATCTIGKTIADESLPTFNELTESLKGITSNVSVSLKLDPFHTGNYATYTIKAKAISINNKIEVIGGTVSLAKNQENNMLFSGLNKDPMTGVLNKNAIIQYAKDRLRIRNTQNITLAILDLDNFKQVNDTLGHAFGDRVILKFADIIRSSIGTAGAVGRFGGDEFIAVIDDLKSVEQLRQYFRAIRTNTELAFKNLAPGLSATCSIGITEVIRLEEEITFENLFKTCDTCLYIAKEFGKNRYVMYDDRTKKVIGTDGGIGTARQTRLKIDTDFNLKMTNLLFEKRLAGIPEIIKMLGEGVALNNINIFLGNELELLYHWGCEDTEKINAKYVFEDNYTSNFNESNVLYLMSAQTLEIKMPSAYKILAEQNIYSAMQYLIKHNNKVIGLISFELPQPGRYWHQNEMNSFMMIAPLMAQLLLNEYINKASN